MKCQKCSAELREDAKFCDECGAKVEIKKRCYKCGSIIDANAIYCPNCNSSLYKPKKAETKLSNVEKINNPLIKCNKCGQEYYKSEYFCPNCGKRTINNEEPEPDEGWKDSKAKDPLADYVEYKVCPKCFTHNKPDADFCENCHENISEVPIKIKNSQAKTVQSVVLFLIAIGLIISFIAIMVNLNGTASTSHSPQTTYQNSTPKVKSELVYDTTEEPIVFEEETDEPTTEAPTEPPTEAHKIINNSSSGGFWASGSGDYVAQGLTVTDYAVLHIEHYGSSNFSVVSYEGDDYDDLLVNEIGNYSGDVLITHSGTFELEINADGNWSITSSGLSIDDTTSFSGSGDAVTGITSHSGGSWKITHNGKSNFSVVEYGLREGYMDLLVNEIGSYSGVVKAESGDDVFFQINADGYWTIEKQ